MGIAGLSYLAKNPLRQQWIIYEMQLFPEFSIGKRCHLDQNKNQNFNKSLTFLFRRIKTDEFISRVVTKND